MKNADILFISKLAIKLRKLLSIDSYDFSLYEVVDKLEGKIEIEKSLEEAIIVKDSKDSFKIILNYFTKDEDIKRFYIAHELGHLFLHMRFKIDEEVWNSIPVGESYNKKNNILFTKCEFQAEKFAEAFLLPTDMFLKCAFENTINGHFDIRAIAVKFNVPIEIVNKRGKSLGVWK